MKKLLSIAAILFIATTSFSQDWEKFHSEQGFDFYMKYTECEFQDVQPQSWAIIKVENTNSFDAEISFYYERYMDGECMGCGVYDEEKLKTFKIPGEGLKEGFCKPGSLKGPLDVFHKFLLVKARELTGLKIVKFSFEKIKIK